MPRGDSLRSDLNLQATFGSARGGGLFSAVIDEKSYNRALKRLERYELLSQQRRIAHIYLEGARFMVRPMRARTPVGPTGNLVRSIRARRPRSLRFGELAAAAVGPTHRRAPHRHLVIQGTKAHDLEAKRYGKGQYLKFPDGNVRRNAGVRHPGSRANPFVQDTFDAVGGQILAFIHREVLKVDDGISMF